MKNQSVNPCIYAWLQGSMEPAAMHHGTLFYVQLETNETARLAGGKVITMLVAILNFLRAWRRYNASLKELYQLGDRELADIGITRSDIPRIAWDNAHRGNL
jgi:uncharacterized protein YjiS (DUF1127 family)